MTQLAFQQLKQTIQMDREHGKTFYLIFGALGDPTRFLIFKVLALHKGFCVSDIAELIGISIPATSQQLKYLEGHELVVRKRLGRKICYEVNYDSPMTKTLIQMIHT